MTSFVKLVLNVLAFKHMASIVKLSKDSQRLIGLNKCKQGFVFCFNRAVSTDCINRTTGFEAKAHSPSQREQNLRKRTLQFNLHSPPPPPPPHVESVENLIDLTNRTAVSSTSYMTVFLIIELTAEGNEGE